MVGGSPAELKSEPNWGDRASLMLPRLTEVEEDDSKAWELDIQKRGKTCKMVPFQRGIRNMQGRRSCLHVGSCLLRRRRVQAVVNSKDDERGKWDWALNAQRSSLSHMVRSGMLWSQWKL